MRSALALLASIGDEALRPRLRRTVTGWADAFRQLSVTSSSQPGQWHTSRTPYLAEIMDVLSEGDPCEDIVFMKGSQLGATEAANNWIGYTLDWSPAPLLMVYPTKDMARMVSQQRIAPLIDETPVLRDRVSDFKSRDAANSTFAKLSANGAILLMTGANTAPGLKGMPIGRLIFDECDEYDKDVAGQGDPCTLAEKRTSNFPNRKRLWISTPTNEESRVNEEMQTTDFRRFHLKCPHCGKWDWLQWRVGGWTGRDGHHHNVHFVNNDADTACIACSECKQLIDPRFKAEMLQNGKWIPTQDGLYRRVGFHLPGLYSPEHWRPLSTCVREFLEAKEDRFKLRGWVNQVLGEVWRDPADEAVEVGSLAARLEEPQAGQVPIGVGILVAAVDVQGDRLEVMVRGYGADEESWLIAYRQIYGDPKTQPPWFQLSEYLKQEFEHQNGQKLRVTVTAIDSRYESQTVYKFCRDHLAGSLTWDKKQGGVVELAEDAEIEASPRPRRVQIFPIRGTQDLGKPLVGRPSTANAYHVPVFPLCVDTGKDIIFARLRKSPPAPGLPAPGFLHLPKWIDVEYLEQLAAEKKIPKYDKKKRRTTRVWHQIRERNEAFDLEVYALAALYMLGPAFLGKLASRAARLAEPTKEKPTAPAEQQRIQRRLRRRGGWVKRY